MQRKENQRSSGLLSIINGENIISEPEEAECGLISYRLVGTRVIKYIENGKYVSAKPIGKMKDLKNDIT